MLARAEETERNDDPELIAKAKPWLADGGAAFQIREIARGLL
jgi:hypothetical protein